VTRNDPRPRRNEPRRRGSLAAKLTAARLVAGLTQAQLADRLGSDVTSVRRWETEATMPRGLYLRAVERFIARSKR